MIHSPESGTGAGGGEGDYDPEDFSWLDELPDPHETLAEIDRLYINPATGKHYTAEELAREGRTWPTAEPPEDSGDPDTGSLPPDA
jgi:hypothetical protein